MTRAMAATISAADARRLLMHGQGLLHDPHATGAEPDAVRRMVEHLGYVQVDSINAVVRAHHHILLTRLAHYDPADLTALLERERVLFEHWTHDASIIPTRWFGHWKHRFRRFERKCRQHRWWRERFGPDFEQVTETMHRRIEREGPLMARDVSRNGGTSSGTWWGWSNEKAVLEYLWHTGRTAITARRNFHKVYDLTERVLPAHADAPMSDEQAHLDWACREAMERLSIATPAEIAAYLRAIDHRQARAWCAAQADAGALEPVHVRSADDSTPRPAFAVSDWRERLDGLPEPPPDMRLLSPFDPLIRDRNRALRLFGFDYRFEAFTPAARRQYGYYVLPILEGDRLVGRVDPVFDRAHDTLVVNAVWWQPGVRPTRRRLAALEEAVNDLACGIGAGHWSLPTEHH